jgi:hypothetical protein
MQHFTQKAPAKRGQGYIDALDCQLDFPAGVRTALDGLQFFAQDHVLGAPSVSQRRPFFDFVCLLIDSLILRVACVGFA